MANEFDDAYTAGVEASHKDGVGFFGPQNTLDEMNSVDTLVQQLNGLVNAAGSKVRAEFKDNWNKYREEWDTYFRQHNSVANPLDYISRSLNETMDKVIEYRTRTVAWNDALAKEGVSVSTPALGNPKDSGEFPWKWVLIGGGLLLGYVLVKEVGKGVGAAAGTVAKSVTS